MEEIRTYELAEMWRRGVAFMIDATIIGFIGGLLGTDISMFGHSLLSFVFVGGYLWYFWTRHNGQTPGKMLMNIRIIKTNGHPFTDADVILRYIGYLISAMLLLLGFIWAFFDDKKQGWHDKIANTYVVKAPQHVTEDKKAAI